MDFASGGEKCAQLAYAVQNELMIRVGTELEKIEQFSWTHESKVNRSNILYIIILLLSFLFSYLFLL